MNIGLTGSIAFDYLMTFPGHFGDHFLADKLESISLSFLVDKMIKRRGGIGPNIGYTMAMLGGSPILFGTVGQDFDEYRISLPHFSLRQIMITARLPVFTPAQ